MSVYVDPVMPYGKSRTWPYPESCHLYADTIPELQEFARRLGLKPSWFQRSPPASLNHYDLTRGMRAKAVHLGAIPVELGHHAGDRVDRAVPSLQAPAVGNLELFP